jgi:ribosomal-protein-alanine N-acetyltransferase
MRRPPPIIETARLRLRPCTSDDLDALHRLWTDRRVRRYLWDDVVISRERAASTLADGIASFARHGFGLWTVTPRDEERLIGFTGLRLTPGTYDVEVVYGMTPERWGEGLASEAVRGVLAFAFAVRRLERVIGLTDPPNVASMRVMEKAGMVRDPHVDAGSGLARYVASRGSWRPEPA